MAESIDERVERIERDLSAARAELAELSLLVRQFIGGAADQKAG